MVRQLIRQKLYVFCCIGEHPDLPKETTVSCSNADLSFGSAVSLAAFLRQRASSEVHPQNLLVAIPLYNYWYRSVQWVFHDFIPLIDGLMPLAPLLVAAIRNGAESMI